ncbi:hypothetical protein OJAV_G00049950 [Oryzias javanicus]|uniref:Cyclin-dependent kinase inhibitor domain-containing protein n=1 Tax=Oryzias javanicus TaxID=123683 RepID=A0A3S2PH32_ORYJA|nr:hypothetical protein OJAV_G00049950 [Oryzias javanicus]
MRTDSGGRSHPGGRVCITAGVRPEGGGQGGEKETKKHSRIFIKLVNCRVMAAPKRIPSAPRRPVRRNLFGPVDREQLQLEYQAALRQDLDEASRRWGFDFSSDKPLESSLFLWESVPGAGVPPMYRSCCRDAGPVQKAAETRTPPKRRRAELPKREKENIPLTPKKGSFNVEKTPQKDRKDGMKRKQTNITDFYQAKRRVVLMPQKSGE